MKRNQFNQFVYISIESASIQWKLKGMFCGFLFNKKVKQQLLRNSKFKKLRKFKLLRSI